jgi:hypothetical protein
VRLLPRDQCRQLKPLRDRHAPDLSRGHLGEDEVVVFQRPPKDRSRMALRGRRYPSPSRDGSLSLELAPLKASRRAAETLGREGARTDDSLRL